MKICPTCKENKSLKFFYCSVSGNEHLDDCKECHHKEVVALHAKAKRYQKRIENVFCEQEAIRHGLR